MSVRGGRGPREDMAAPVSDGGGKRPNGYQRTGRYGRGPGDQRRYDRYGDRRGGMRGLLGFVVFLAVLAAIVMIALLTVARPIARLAIVPLRRGQPEGAADRLHRRSRAGGPRRVADGRGRGHRR